MQTCSKGFDLKLSKPNMPKTPIAATFFVILVPRLLPFSLKEMEISTLDTIYAKIAPYVALMRASIPFSA